MSVFVGSHHHKYALLDRIGHHRLLAGSILGALLGVAVYALAMSAAEAAKVGFDARTASAPAAQYPARELPPEWEHEVPGVQVEHMYGSSGRQRSDWIKPEKRRWRSQR